MIVMVRPWSSRPVKEVIRCGFACLCWVQKGFWELETEPDRSYYYFIIFKEGNQHY